MVDLTNLNAAGALNSERIQVATALDLIDKGGKIVEMRIATEGDVITSRSTVVSTVLMTYPQQMIESIKHFLIEREEQLLQQLIEIGVSGVDEARR